MEKSKGSILLYAGTLTIACTLISSCASVDADSVRPRLNIPSQALVEQISISYDQSLPLFLLAVDRVELSTGRSLSKSEWSSETKDKYNRKDSDNRTDDTTEKTNRKVSGEVTDKGYVLERDERKMSAKTDVPGSMPENYEAEGTKKHGVKGENTTSYSETVDDEVTKTAKRTGGYTRNDSRTISRQGKSKHESTYFEVAPETDKIRAQLTSALTGVGNFRVVRKEDDFGRLDLSGIRAGSNEKGPYIIRAVITEFGTLVGEHRSRTELGLYHSKSSELTFVVGLDVEIRDPRTSRVLAAFPVHSAFGESELKRGAGLILGAGASDMKRSGLDQALRVALNDAASKSFEALKRGS